MKFFQDHDRLGYPAERNMGLGQQLSSHQSQPHVHNLTRLPTQSHSAKPSVSPRLSFSRSTTNGTGPPPKEVKQAGIAHVGSSSSTKFSLKNLIFCAQYPTYAHANPQFQL